MDTLISIAKALGIDSRVFAIFTRTDHAILAEHRQLPQLPERAGGALQICENIVLLRKSKNITQKQLALLSGISTTRLRDIEHGCANITIGKLTQVACAFGLSLIELNNLTMPEEELMELVQKARIMAGIRRG